MRPEIDRRAVETPVRADGSIAAVPNKPIPAPGRERRREPRVTGHELVTVQWTDPDGRARAERARIIDRSKKGLGLHLAVPIPSGTQVDLSGGTTASAVVRHCRLDGDSYVVGLLRRNNTDRRDDRRMRVEGVGRLVWHTSGSDQHELDVNVRDASSEGLQVEAPHEIPVPIILRILGEGVDLIAETRYCTPREQHFLVGLRYVRFPEPSGLSRRPASPD